MKCNQCTRGFPQNNEVKHYIIKILYTNIIDKLVLETFLLLYYIDFEENPTVWVVIC